MSAPSAVTEPSRAVPAPIPVQKASRSEPTPTAVQEAPRAEQLAEFTAFGKKTAAEKMQAARERVSKIAELTKAKTIEVASNKALQASAASAAGGAVVGGTSGAAAGLAIGGAAGAAAGVIPAFFTFGLSIPFGAVAGAGCGTAAGAAAGSAAGFVGGCATGYGVYTKRKELMHLFEGAKKTLLEFVTKVEVAGKTRKTAIAKKLSKARVEAARLIGVGKARTIASATAAKTKTVAIVSDKAVQVTAASAASGAAIVGAVGATTGFLAGGALGAVVGIAPAIFTFGLSIPFGAAVGSACGVAIGAATGGSVGLVGGSTVGYGAYTKREVIGSSIKSAQTNMGCYAGYVKEKASTAASEIRVRLVGGTGGTS